MGDLAVEHHRGLSSGLVRMNIMRADMRTRLVRGSRVTLVITTILLVVVLAVVVFHTDGIILFRTSRRVYDRDDYIRGALINLSRHDVEIRSSEPLIYESSDFGWVPPFFFFTFVYYPRTYEPGWVQSGGVLPMDLAVVEVKASDQKWIQLEQQYFYNGNEYVVYSNRLVIDKHKQPPILRTPPTGLIEAPSIRADIVELYVVSLSNEAAKDVWFNPICSDIDPDDLSDDYSLGATLQRRTSEGTWQVYRADSSQCRAISEPLRIKRGETVDLFLGDGYPTSDTFEPGVYRWHLVYYVDPFPQCDHLCELQGAHLFTETFEW